MIVGRPGRAVFGVKAERRRLEDIAAPLSTATANKPTCAPPFVRSGSGRVTTHLRQTDHYPSGRVTTYRGQTDHDLSGRLTTHLRQTDHGPCGRLTTNAV